MPVNSTHPDYDLRISDWRKCRDAFEGEAAIKAAGPAYLPRASGLSTEEYNAYKERALFYSITNKSVSALAGMATAKPAALSYPKELESYFKDASGMQFHELFTKSVSETLLMGRIGILVDRDGPGEPYFAIYTAESIINWAHDDAGKLVQVTLSEQYLETDANDKFKRTKKLRYRVLEIVNGVYTQTIYNAGESLASAGITPKNYGKPMNFIPFTVINPFGLGFEDSKPPMLDIVSVNISHYRSSADLEHGRHFTALPTPVVSGVDGSTTLKIGALSAWILPDPNARAYYLEFTGVGLGSLEKAITEKQSQLASLSARLLDNSKRGSEAAETVKLRYASETASLSTVVLAVEAGLTEIFTNICVLLDIKPEISIVLNKEFLDGRLSGAEVQKFVQSYLDGGMSKETLVYILRRGDVIPMNRTDEEELASLVQAEEARQQSAMAAASGTNQSSDNSGVTK